MEYTPELEVGRIRVMEKRNKGDYMLRSEKRQGGYHSKPPRRGNPFGRFLYAVLTLVVLVVLWPIGLVMLWSPKLRWTGVSKLLTSLVTALMFFLFIAYLLTVPVENPQVYEFQQRARRGFVAVREDVTQWMGKQADAVGEQMTEWNEGFQAALENIAPIAGTLYNEGMYHITGWIRDGAETMSRWLDPDQQTVWAENGIYHTRRACEENHGTAITLGEAQGEGMEQCELCAAPEPEVTPTPTAEPTPETTQTPEVTPENTPEPTQTPEPTPQPTFRVVNTVEAGEVAPAGAATSAPTPTYAPQTPAPTATPQPTPDPTPELTAAPVVAQTPVTEATAGAEPTQTAQMVQPSSQINVMAELMDVADAHVWYTGNGKYYHKYSSCGSMENAKRHTLAEAFAAGRETCPWCHPLSKADLDIEEPVWMTDATHVFHISDDCAQLGDAWTFMTLDDALKDKGNPCEECGAYHYVNELPLPEKVAQKEAMEAAKAAAATPVPKAAYAGGETIVYYGDKSKYYHANSGCRTITSAAPHTLQEAVDAGKQNCPQCAAPLLEQ